MEKELKSKKNENTDKKLNISDVRNSVELMLENEKQIMNGLAVDKLCGYHNDTYSFSRCGKQKDLDKTKHRVGTLNDVLKHCF